MSSGGFIELHIDSNSRAKNEFEYNKPEEWLIQSERLMTFMVYLSDVGAGGHTVFPNLGLSVPPVRGSALFWHTINSEVSESFEIIIIRSFYNYCGQGLMDQRMKHLGCPVVHGDKWIVNKWVKWHHHMFSHPCTDHDIRTPTSNLFYKL
mgnify:FL=1